MELMRLPIRIIFTLTITFHVIGFVSPVNASEVENRYSFFNVENTNPTFSTEFNPYTPYKEVSGWGLIGAWGLTVVTAIAMNDELLETTMIPIVGPYITKVRIEEGEYYGYLPGGKGLLALSFISQAAFAISYGIFYVKERNYRPTVSYSLRGDLNFGLSYAF